MRNWADCGNPPKSAPKIMIGCGSGETSNNLSVSPKSMATDLVFVDFSMSVDLYILPRLPNVRLRFQRRPRSVSPGKRETRPPTDDMLPWQPEISNDIHFSDQQPLLNASRWML